MRRTIDRWIESLPRRVDVAPPCDGQARANARHAVRQLEHAGDQLTAAYTTAGIKLVAKVGENHAAQRSVAREQPDRALAWIAAEIIYLERYELAVRAERNAGVQTIPGGCFPAAAEQLFTDIQSRIATLHALAAEIEERERGVLPVDHDPLKLARLDRALAFQVNRVLDGNTVKGRQESHAETLKRALRLSLNDAPHVVPMARSLVGDQFDKLVRQRLTRILG